MPTYEFTTVEGGEFTPIKVSMSEMEVESLLILSRYYDTALSSWRSKLGCFTVFAVRFPSGRIWDSHFGNFPLRS